MFIRYNSSIKFWEYDTSVGQNGVGPWLILPVDPSNMLGGGSVSPHHLTHEPGGSDPLNVDAIPATGSLRTLGPGAQQAAPGNDARFTNSRPPTAHHATHETGGADAIAALSGAVITTGTVADARLSTNVPLKNANNHFTQVQVIDDANVPELQLNNTTKGQLFRVLTFLDKFWIYINGISGGFAVDLNGAIYERARSTPIGDWLAFTPTVSSNAGSISLAGATLSASYIAVGRTVALQFNLTSASISGSPTEVFFSIPMPISTAANVVGRPAMAFPYFNGSDWIMALAYGVGGEAQIRVNRALGFVSGTNNMHLWGTIIIPV